MLLNKTILMFECVFVLFCSFLSLEHGVSADVTSHDIAASLVKNLEHPYLYFTEKDKPDILKRIKTDPDCNAIMQQLLAEANRL